MNQHARVAKYELEKFLGGGLSEVYQARDTVLGRTVALKILTGQAALNDETRARFTQTLTASLLAAARQLPDGFRYKS